MLNSNKSVGSLDCSAWGTIKRGDSETAPNRTIVFARTIVPHHFRIVFFVPDGASSQKMLKKNYFYLKGLLFPTIPNTIGQF